MDGTFVESCRIEVTWSKLPGMEAGVSESTMERVTLYRMEPTFVNSSRGQLHCHIYEK